MAHKFVKIFINHFEELYSTTEKNYMHMQKLMKLQWYAYGSRQVSFQYNHKVAEKDRRTAKRG